jgi:DNA mismatch endonuclease (patch repair protein)
MIGMVITGLVIHLIYNIPMDVHTKEQRSFNMSQVKSKNTKPEIQMFKILKDKGYKFKKHYRIVGQPDVAFPDLKIAVFIDGEFWHGKNFPNWKFKMSDFWQKKISSNISRDIRCDRLLRKSGWHVVHLWDKSILRSPEKAVLRIERFIAKFEPK